MTRQISCVVRGFDYEIRAADHGSVIATGSKIFSESESP
jgi:hypothetical protein